MVRLKPEVEREVDRVVRGLATCVAPCEFGETEGSDLARRLDELRLNGLLEAIIAEAGDRAPEICGEKVEAGDGLEAGIGQQVD